MAEDPDHAKVDDLEIAIVIDQQVFNLEISVHDAAVVEVLDAKDELDGEELDLLFSKLLLLKNQLKFATANKWHDKVESFVGLEEVVDVC